MRAIAAVLVGSTLGFLVYGVGVDSPAVATYVLTTIAIVILVGLVHRSAEFSRPALWALTALAIGNLAGGVLLIAGDPLYELDIVAGIRFDKVYHAIASGAAVVVSFQALEHWAGQRRPILVLPAFLMALGAGALVEAVEYTASLYQEDTLVGDYSNNAQDLIANTIGASIAAVGLLVWLDRSKR